MPFPEPYSFYLEPLERTGIPYGVTGSIAAGIYGEIRTTHDIDFVLLLTVSDIAKFRAAFPETEYYVPPVEVLINELLRGQRGCVNLYHHRSGFRADIYFVVRDPLHLWAMEHRRRLAYGEEHLWVAPPEYVLLRKLEFFREGRQDKHVRDCSHMLAVTPIERGFVEAHVERLGLRAQWEEVLEAHRLTGGTWPE